MEVITIESSAFQELQSMFRESCLSNSELRKENKRLKEKKLLSPLEVAEMTGYNEKTIRQKKDEIGFFTVGKEILFKPEALDAWIERNYIKPRVK